MKTETVSNNVRNNPSMEVGNLPKMGYSAKLKNRRVYLANLDGGGYIAVFKRLGETGEPRVVVTAVALTEEAFCAMQELWLQCRVDRMERSEREPDPDGDAEFAEAMRSYLAKEES